MHLRSTTALLACLFLAVPASSADKPEDAIKTVLDDQVKAWNKGDLDGFMAGYWKSEKLTFSAGGEETQGWNATMDRYRKKYKAKDAEMGKLTFSDLRIEKINDEYAYVRGKWEVETSKAKNKGLFTLILKKFNDGWRIIHDHTS